MTFLHNAGKFDSQVGRCLFCNKKKGIFKVSSFLPSLPPLKQQILFLLHIILTYKPVTFPRRLVIIHTSHNLLSSSGVLASLSAKRMCWTTAHEPVGVKPS